MFNTFIDMPDSYTDFKIDIQIRHYTVQALKLLKTQINLPLSSLILEKVYIHLI